MPERGIIKCVSCNKEFEGELPDNFPVGNQYEFILWKKEEIDPELARKLQAHHGITAKFITKSGPQGGHSDFEVFLPNGRKGKCEVCSSYVLYRELEKRI